MDNVDDPNLRYVSPFLTAIHTFAQTDDDTFVEMLHYLATKADRSVTVIHEDIKKLNMFDLRPLLAAGQYDKIARTVLDRLSTSESPP